ncbi:leucine-rich repeat domain-containing protein [Abyssisolibacter fermentans]|uniref:leucine-rich repeat domain-containing protein n=1 Tax=Abyssisolibacter fermentans TaxID=1766203 RepID=UPI000832E476|nr:leucine-rich repeat domain-containing protein [Abyssisolibacter fermentans]
MDKDQLSDYKKSFYFYSISLIGCLWLYIVNYKYICKENLVVIALVTLAQNIVLWKEHKKEKVVLSVLFLFKYIIINNHINFRDHILLCIYLTIMASIYLYKYSSKHRLSKVLTVILIVLLVFYFDINSHKQSLIKDIYLENIVQKHLKDYYPGRKVELTKENLDKITRIYISEHDAIINLEGLESLTNLRSLYIKCNKIENVYVLGKLSQLTNLDICDTSIDWSEIKELKALEYLDLSYMEFEKLNQDAFPILKEIHIQGLEANDLSFIKDLNTLEKIDICFSQLETLDCLECLTNLEMIDFYKVKVSNIDILKEMKSLKKIEITECEINGIDEFKKESKVRVIKRRKNRF